MISIFARLVSSRPHWVLAFWIVLALVSVPLAALAPARLVANSSTARDSEAQRATQIFETAFNQVPTDRTLLVTQSDLSPADPEFLRRYDALIEQIRLLEGVRTLTRFDQESPLQLSGQVEGRSVTATLIDTDLEHGEALIDRIRQFTTPAQTTNLSLYVTGATAITKDFLDRVENDAKRSELTALPLTGLVLIIAFGALVAAGVPLVIGVLSITTAMAMIFGLTHLIQVSSFAQSVITMLGLGAGVDYALLMVNRFREELARGLSPRRAAEVTTLTAGRSVAFSGLTVGIAMASLLVPDLAFARSMGMGGVLVIAITVLSSITAVPALLALLGHRINQPRLLRVQFSQNAGKFWGYWAQRVMVRPLPFALAITALLVVLASPTATMRLGYTGAFGLSSEVESRRGLDLIRGLELGGTLDAFEILIDLGEENAFDSEARSKWRDLEAELSQWPEVRMVISPFLAARGNGGTGGLGDLVSLTDRSISQDRRYLRLTVIPRQPIPAEEIPTWISQLRQTTQQYGFSRVLLGGAPVGSQEFTDALVGAMPLAIGLVFLATFVLLGIAFRSLLIPLKSILMNTLTVSAAYGVITQIFQHGTLASLFGVSADLGVVDSSLPLVLFAIIFGLSMDYEIFLLSRVQEGHLAGLDTRQAVQQALVQTGGIISSAAIIMIIVFLAFVQGDVTANKTIGMGLAVAVFLDATLVRLLLVPAVMVLAGRWNWWLPRSLDRLLPQVRLEH